jgi:release factor glutamine methyltransferase
LTVREALEGAARQLGQAGIANGRGEAEILLGRLLGAGRTDLYLRGDEPLDSGVARTLALWLLRRQAGEPIQYLTGEAPYRHLVLEVGPGVFIPRPETELLVDEVLAFLAARDRAGAAGAPRILEACTGSGAIALALAGERPDAVVVATELSPRAMEWAARNRARCDLTARVHLVRCDLAAALAGPFDVLVSNPPYVAESERPLLPPDVLDHEPHLALFAAHAGLAAIERLVSEGARLLTPGGLLAFEIGEAQGAAVRALLEGAGGYADVRIRHDLAGRDRMALARRCPEGPSRGA